MKNLLRLYIREAIRRLTEKDVINEPDEREEEKQDEMISLGGGGIRGATAPMGTGPTYPDEPKTKKKKKKKKSDTVSRAFGGGEYEG